MATAATVTADAAYGPTAGQLGQGGQQPRGGLCDATAVAVVGSTLRLRE